MLSFTVNYLWRIIFQSIHLNSYKEDKDSWEKQPVEVIEQLQVWSALDNMNSYTKDKDSWEKQPVEVIEQL